jgi:iron(III) transport system permease protein
MTWLRRWRLDVFAVVGVPLVLALLLLIVYPLTTAVIRTFVGAAGINLAPLRRILADPAFSKAFLNTLIVIAVAGTSAVLLGSLFAWLNERTDGNLGIVSGSRPRAAAHPPGGAGPRVDVPGRADCRLPERVRARGPRPRRHPAAHRTPEDRQLAGSPVPVHDRAGAVRYVVVSPAFRNMDASLEEASRMSGAGPVRTAVRISLPVIGPAILSAALLVLIIAAAMLLDPAIIGTSARIPTISVYIVNLTLESAAA